MQNALNLTTEVVRDEKELEDTGRNRAVSD
jgi:hypothetical protein